MSTNLTKQAYKISQQKRMELAGHKPLVLWFVGLSGSGKSTVSDALETFLYQKGFRTTTLDGDNIRMGINKDLDFSAKARSENIRRIAEIGKLFIEAGVIALTAFITPLAKDRNRAKEILGNHYVEIFVNCPLEVCEKRDVKGLYAKARKGEIPNFTGISAPFEKPENPDVEILTHKESIDECVTKIWNTIQSKITIQS
ncbi:MAG: adenylyl-sulfate kinase [Leeuwenhoekiella sp.]